MVSLKSRTWTSVWMSVKQPDDARTERLVLGTAEQTGGGDRGHTDGVFLAQSGIMRMMVATTKALSPPPTTIDFYCSPRTIRRVW